MKVVSIVGARPQFIKAFVLSRELRLQHEEVLVHTGQHYDRNLSAIFFEELGLPEPDVNLGVGSLSHGAQTAEMLAKIELLLIREAPDWALVYGDTNSTLAGALAAAKLQIPIAHVEAGLRSFNRAMPEEINRLVADHLARLLLCPSQTAVDNLQREGITQGVHLVGDVMADALKYAADLTSARRNILDQIGLDQESYVLVTIHRAENTDDQQRLSNIVRGLSAIREPVIFPLHLRTRKALEAQGLLTDLSTKAKYVHLIEPLSYLDMVRLEEGARLILTDSGGMQKEAYWLGVPCLTLREETEWVETVASGWNVLVGADADKILDKVRSFSPPAKRPPLYGDGAAAQRCVALLSNQRANHYH